MAVTQYSHGPSKVAKAIRKKKGPNSTTSLNADSRDARKLTRATLRDEKLYRHALIRDKANEKYLQRAEFFKLAAEAALDAEASTSTASTSPDPNATNYTPVPAPEESPFTTALLSRLISTYISRHSEELSEIKSTRRPGRSASPQELVLQQLIADEKHEFDTGFWIPDLRDAFTCYFLARRWDGSWSALGPLKFVRLTKAASTKTAKGDSVEKKGQEGSDVEVPDVSVRESKFPPKGDW